MRGAVGWKLALCIAVLAPLCGLEARAQTITSSNRGFGATRRGGDNAAEEQRRSDWPRVANGETGTQVHITFDPRNVDVVLVTERVFGLTPLFTEAQRLAKALDRPEADFITFMGQKTVT